MNGKQTLVQAPTLKNAKTATQEFIAKRGCESQNVVQKQTVSGWFSENGDALLAGLSVIAIGTFAVIVAPAAIPLIATTAAAAGAWVGASAAAATLATAGCYAVAVAGGCKHCIRYE